MRHKASQVLVLAYCLMLCNPCRLAAIQSQDGLAEHTAVLGANALLGAATGGVRALIEGKNVSRAVARGALGGLLIFTGKRIAVTRWDPAPFPGRLVAAVGGSIVANATSGGILDTVFVPVGPLRLALRSGHRSHPTVAVAMNDVIALLLTLSQSDLQFDWKRSAASLTPVFRTTFNTIRLDGNIVAGVTGAGVVVLDGRSGNQIGSTFRHELVHVLQNDFMEVSWDRPLQGWVRSNVPGGDLVPRWLSLNYLVPLLTDGSDAIAHGNGILRRMTQAEAEWFERR